MIHGRRCVLERMLWKKFPANRWSCKRCSSIAACRKLLGRVRKGCSSLKLQSSPAPCRRHFSEQTWRSWGKPASRPWRVPKPRRDRFTADDTRFLGTNDGHARLAFPNGIMRSGMFAGRTWRPAIPWCKCRENPRARNQRKCALRMVPIPDADRSEDPPGNKA